jgi:hypothetical protein
MALIGPGGAPRPPRRNCYRSAHTIADVVGAKACRGPAAVVAHKWQTFHLSYLPLKIPLGDRLVELKSNEANELVRYCYGRRSGL